MFPTTTTTTSTTVAAPRVGHGIRVIRRYRHDPYGARVLEPLPAVLAAIAATSTSTTSSINSAGGLTPATSISTPTTTTTPTAAGEEETTNAGMDCVARDILPTVRGKGTAVYTGIVAFKYGAKEFNTTTRVRVGDAVVVDGDRGEDLGFVQSVTAQNIVNHNNINNNNNHFALVGERVRRIATAEDLQQHQARAQKEEEALCTMRMLAKEVKCPAFIQDIMYQLDSRKITVIIARESRSYVDFRRLQRAAFDVFRCRVWCEYLDEITAPQLGSGCDASASTPALQLPQRPLYGRRSRCQAIMPDSRDMIAQA
ncbi:PSP1 [Trypanosoma melophagium]|uniref:PSP1 n=1 Tax=Trypanosoma melophagium TaxID=715481 RepID=UPI00351A5206|nr:PSP1 [Trypanosoma melophagium]